MLQFVIVEIGNTDRFDVTFLVSLLQQTVACHVIAVAPMAAMPVSPRWYPTTMVSTRL